MFRLLSHLERFALFQNWWFVRNQFVYFAWVVHCIIISLRPLCTVGQPCDNKQNELLVNWVQWGGDSPYWHFIDLSKERQALNALPNTAGKKYIKVRDHIVHTDKKSFGSCCHAEHIMGQWCSHCKSTAPGCKSSWDHLFQAISAQLLCFKSESTIRPKEAGRQNNISSQSRCESTLNVLGEYNSWECYRRENNWKGNQNNTEKHGTECWELKIEKEENKINTKKAKWPVNILRDFD